MLHRRLHRRLVTWLLAFCVVFAQSAALAYACQRLVEPETATTALCAAHLKDVADDGVKAPLADANVCEVHCHDALLPDAGPADAPAADTAVAWRVSLPEMAPTPSTLAAELEAKSAAPPPRTLYARLLI